MQKAAHDILAVLSITAFMVLAVGCSERKAELVEEDGLNTMTDPKAEYPRITFPDGQTSLNDRCMVLGSRLSKRFPPVYVNGKPVAFCCTPCSKAFVQDPLPHIIERHLSFLCVVNPSKMALLDVDHMRKVNWEIFLLSDDGAVKKFDDDPIKYCGILTDPVTGKRFKPGDDSPTLTYRRQLFYFLNDSTKQVFEENPAGHKEPDLSRPELWWKIQPG